MTGLHSADIAVVIGYLVGVTALGVWAGRGAKNVSPTPITPARIGGEHAVASYCC